MQGAGIVKTKYTPNAPPPAPVSGIHTGDNYGLYQGSEVIPNNPWGAVPKVNSAYTDITTPQARARDADESRDLMNTEQPSEKK